MIILLKILWLYHVVVEWQRKENSTFGKKWVHKHLKIFWWNFIYQMTTWYRTYRLFINSQITGSIFIHLAKWILFHSGYVFFQYFSSYFLLFFCVFFHKTGSFVLRNEISLLSMMEVSNPLDYFEMVERNVLYCNYRFRIFPLIRLAQNWILKLYMR